MGEALPNNCVYMWLQGLSRTGSTSKSESWVYSGPSLQHLLGHLRIGKPSDSAKDSLYVGACKAISAAGKLKSCGFRQLGIESQKGHMSPGGVKQGQPLCLSSIRRPWREARRRVPKRSEAGSLQGMVASGLIAVSIEGDHSNGLAA